MYALLQTLRKMSFETRISLEANLSSVRLSLLYHRNPEYPSAYDMILQEIRNRLL